MAEDDLFEDLCSHQSDDPGNFRSVRTDPCSSRRLYPCCVYHYDIMLLLGRKCRCPEREPGIYDQYARRNRHHARIGRRA